MRIISYYQISITIFLTIQLILLVMTMVIVALSTEIRGDHFLDNNNNNNKLAIDHKGACPKSLWKN